MLKKFIKGLKAFFSDKENQSLAIELGLRLGSFNWITDVLVTTLVRSTPLGNVELATKLLKFINNAVVLTSVQNFSLSVTPEEKLQFAVNALKEMVAQDADLKVKGKMAELYPLLVELMYQLKKIEETATK